MRTDRWRRRALWLAAVPVLLLVVAVTTVLTRSGSDDPDTVVLGVTETRDLPSSSVTAVTTTTTVPTTATTTGAATSSTTRPRTFTTTTRAPATTAATTATTATGAPETTATTVDDRRPPGPACTPSMFQPAITLDRTSYSQGQRVNATATFTNTSGQTCYWASTTGGYDVLDSAGRSVTYRALVIADAFRWIAFPSGDTHTANHSWDQQACSAEAGCSPAPRGSYTFVVSLQPYGEARTTFTLA